MFSIYECKYMSVTFEKEFRRGGWELKDKMTRGERVKIMYDIHDVYNIQHIEF